MKKIILFFTLFSIISCQKEEFETLEIQQVNQEYEESYLSPEVDELNSKRKFYCDGLDFVLIGVKPFGSVEEACQYGICAALYDLDNHYTTEEQGYISGISDGSNSELGGSPGGATLNGGINSTTNLILTKESLGNYYSYLKRLKQNIFNDPDNAEYWEKFIDCYKSQIPTRPNSNQPFTP